MQVHIRQQTQLTPEQLNVVLLDLEEFGWVTLGSIDAADQIARAAGPRRCRIRRDGNGTWWVELVNGPQPVVPSSQQALVVVLVTILILAASAGWWDRLLPW